MTWQPVRIMKAMPLSMPFSRVLRENCVSLIFNCSFISFIYFVGSKLTQVLKDSFVGKRNTKLSEILELFEIISPCIYISFLSLSPSLSLSLSLSLSISLSPLILLLIFSPRYSAGPSACWIPQGDPRPCPHAHLKCQLSVLHGFPPIPPSNW